MNKETKSKVVIVLFALPFLIGGLWALTSALKIFNENSVSKKWPSTEGSIVSSEIASRRVPRRGGGRRHGTETCYSAHVTYKYIINVVEYSSTRVSLSDYCSTGRGHAQEVINRYPTGKSVTVYYNPLDSEKAILESTLGGGFLICLTAGIILTGVAAVLLSTLRNSENQ